jgi:hypothetical protein
LSGPSYVFGDNQSVFANERRPESMLKKKSATHCLPLRERGSCNGDVTAYEPTDSDLGDLMTKALPGRERRSLD